MGAFGNGGAHFFYKQRMKLTPRNSKVSAQPVPAKASKLAPLRTVTVTHPEPACPIPVESCNSDTTLQQIKSYIESLTANMLASRYVFTEDSVTGGGSLANNLTISLVNDEASPGTIKYYGTDINGVKGYYTIPLGGSIQYQDEGIDLGIPFGTDTLNFTGPHITASRTGNTITVETDTFVDAFNTPI